MIARLCTACTVESHGKGTPIRSSPLARSTPRSKSHWVPTSMVFSFRRSLNPCLTQYVIPFVDYMRLSFSFVEDSSDRVSAQIVLTV
jgi:hypothetical protein